MLEHFETSSSLDGVNVPGWRLHPLKGQLEGFWAIDVSANVRIVFRFDRGTFTDIDMLDYH